MQDPRVALKMVELQLKREELEIKAIETITKAILNVAKAEGEEAGQQLQAYEAVVSMIEINTKARKKTLKWQCSSSKDHYHNKRG